MKRWLAARELAERECALQPRRDAERSMQVSLGDHEGFSCAVAGHRLTERHVPLRKKRAALSCRTY